ncbi:MAG: NAD(P)/FAD-dependent oxidoreductase [Planctomycetaceae bacterium]|nr:NAD(P)/FAD-dependent oxidoreductase [Planctomycetaceae bacterium]
MSNIIIIGAGPAGLTAGIAAAEKLQKQRRNGFVTILERNSRAGKKFLITGSGQCNITRGGLITGFLKNYGGSQKERFVKPALFNFDNAAVIRFFEDNGVPLWEREDGKMFPRSLKAADLLDVFLNKFSESGGVIETDTKAETIRKTETGFVLETNHGTKTADKIILAAGGSSYPATGSDGSGFALAEQLGHRIVPPKPALTPVYVRDYPFTDCAGISFENITFRIKRNGKLVVLSGGTVLLTHHGLSGPGILNASRCIEPDDVMFLELSKEGRNIQQFLSGRKTVKNALHPLNLPEHFLEVLLTVCGIMPDKPVAEILREERKIIETALTACPFTVEKLGDWNEAKATAGGVALEEVNRQTMESRVIPNLFFCGEVLDIDGDTGGYNLQFALSSGFLAGEKAAKQSGN